MDTHKNRKYTVYRLTDRFKAQGKEFPAYSEDRDGAIRRNYQKTTKKWRKQNGF